MRMIQITDPHLGEAGEDTLGIDVRANFLNALEAARALYPDQIVLTGDLCFRHGNQNVYRWVKQQMDELEIPYELISGNHDDPALLADIFGKTQYLRRDEIFFAQNAEGFPIIFLDTTTGRMSWQQQEWLNDQLQQIDCEVIVFMHHPPLQSGVPYMDQNYPLHNMADVQAIFFAHPHPLTVFCGHYHVEKTIHQHNVTVHITPSTFYQIDQFSEAFQVDHHRPGFRVINLEPNKCSHTVRYF